MDRLFPIRSYGRDFFTGICADGRQVVIGLICPEIVAVFFDAEGNYVGEEQRFWGDEVASVAGRKPIYKIFGDRVESMIAQQIKSWHAELGYRPATIQVK